MNSCQFKFKPDKIKYLSNIDTLDSSHKKITSNIIKKRNNLPKKIKKLDKLKDDLKEIESKKDIGESKYITERAKIIDEISSLNDELKEIENYEDEIDYYSKTYQILFNYYDIMDGQIENEIKNDNFNNIKSATNIDDNILKSDSNYLTSDVSEINNENNENIKNKENNENNKDEENWNFDGITIFNNKSGTLDILNQLSKMKRKEKKTTRKRIKNIESLIKDNNYNIYDFINSSKNNLNSNVVDEKSTTDIQNPNEYDVHDRAKLYEDYKIILEGYPSKKRNTKPCLNCNIDKILIYSEGIYACMKCGEVENCIVESEVTNYKDPMIEKPTFPYKRKNHFCEWTDYNCSLELILKKLANLLKLFYNKLIFI